MPLYTYECTAPECGAKVDLKSTVEDRNQPKTHVHKRPDGFDCINTMMVRGENVEVTAFTPYSWRP